MGEFVNVQVEGLDDVVRIFGDADSAKGVFLLRDALDDIADRIEEIAKILAPSGESGSGGSPGDLKAHPTERQTIFGAVETRAPLFVKKGEQPGASFAIRGPRGFVPGRGTAAKETVSHIEITLPDHPEYARWVHTGTGVFGPYKTPIVPVHAKRLIYYQHGEKHIARSVKGQPAQPYLHQAYEFVDRDYVPKRIALLRTEIKFAT